MLNGHLNLCSIAYCRDIMVLPSAEYQYVAMEVKKWG